MSVVSDVSRALKWSAAGSIFAQTVTWAMTLLVVRLLTPADYGLMGLATGFMVLFVLINEVGLGPALVQSKNLTERQIRSVAGLVMAMSLAFSLLFVAMAPLVSWFFGEDRLRPILSVLALNFVLSSIGTAPSALLIRNLDFRRKSLVEAGANLAAGAMALLLAYHGHGVWALVWASLCATGLKSIGFWFAAPQRIWPMFDLRDSSAMFAFGGAIAAQRLVWWFYSQADVFAIGKIQSASVVGIYAVALHLASLPQTKIGATINQITFSGFSRIQSDRERVRSYLIKAIRFLSLLAFPVSFGMSSVAPELVGVILGPNWAAAALPLQLLCLVIPLRMVNTPVNETLNALGRPMLMLTNLMITSALIVPSIMVGAMHGILGVSLAWVLAFPVALAVNVLRASPHTGLTLKDLMANIWRPLAAALFMYGVVAALRMELPDGMSLAVRLGCLVLAGAAAYGLAVMLIDRRSFLDLIAFLRPGGGAPKAPAR